MMTFLAVNAQELSALMGLPHTQQLAYLIGIRPYMDRQNCIVGIKRKISYQSLAESLYVEPHQGIKGGSPNREQLRRIIKGLERVGLIKIQSSDKNLIVKCLLANQDYSVQNKPDTNPTPYPDTNPCVKNVDFSKDFQNKTQKADIGEKAKADTPLIKDNYLYILRNQFETFWLLYPEKKCKQKSWEQFQQLNPDNQLFSKIITGLKAQIANREARIIRNLWIPALKYPNSWLAERRWEDEINMDLNSESKNAVSDRHYKKADREDWFAAPIESAGESEEISAANVIQLKR